MRLLRILPLAGLAALILGILPLSAQITTARTRIVDRIDESQLTKLSGNTHPYAKAKYDTGRVNADLPMTDLILVLNRSTEQQAAFDAFVASQYDAQSPNYHQWLTAAQLGENFGPSLADITTLSSWLQGKGFSVDEVAPDRMTIRFSGTAGMVEKAFHVEMHNLLVKGQAHIANMSDPQIPTALMPTVVGIKSLHNFFPRPLHHLGQAVTRDAQTGKWQRSGVPATLARGENTFSALPQYGITVPASGSSSSYLVEDVAPYDFATIYNVLPLWNASTPIDGTGQTIAIAGTSSIRTADVSAFRTAFGLPTSSQVNTPILLNGSPTNQPLTVCKSTSSSALCGIDDQVENALDVEWSGSVAKNAQIVLVSSYPASSSDDNLYDSESYILNNIGNASSALNNARVMNVSYGECELGNGTAGNVEYYNLWQKAAAEGVAVFVASGDSGSASCDDGGDANGVPYAAEYGLSVSGLASTPWNTAVGGTDFNWCPLTTTTCSASPYWNSTNNSTTNASALGYVPEIPWNDTCASTATLAWAESFWSGVYSVTDEESSCNALVDYQNSLNRNGDGSLLYLVDTVGGSGGKSSCVANDSSTVASCSNQTTTGSANGSIALYNDGWPKPAWQTGVTGIPSDGVRDIPDVSFFASDGFLSSSAYLICVSDLLSSGQSCTSYYANSKSEPVDLEVGGTSVATPAMAGVMALINQKAGSTQGNPNTQLYQLAAKQTYSNCSAEKATTSNGCYFNDIDTGNNATPCDYTDGSPNCSIVHSGDEVGILPGYSAGVGYDMATGLGSLNVANVVNAWVSTGGTTASTVTIAKNPTTAIPINASVTISGMVASGSGSVTTTPTGTVYLSGDGYNASQSLSSGSYSFVIPANSLTAGSDTMTVNYTGDATFVASSNSISVTVNAMTPTITINGGSALSGNIANALSVPVTVSGPSGATTPTGTVTIAYGSTYASSAYSLTSGSYTFSIPAGDLPGGTDTLTVTYSGDSNYSGGNNTAQATMSTVQPLTPTVTVTPASSSISTGQSLSVKVTVTGSGATPSGYVTLSSGSFTSTVNANGGTLNSSGVGTIIIPANSLTGSASGTLDTLKANYYGDANYATGSGSGTVTVTNSTFAVSLSSTSGTVAPGSSATSTISLTSSTYYTSTAITLSCQVSTTMTSYSYAPTCSTSSTPTITAGVTGTTAMLTISTTAATSSMFHPGGKGHGWQDLGGGAVLALLVFFGIPARRRSWRAMLGVLILLAGFGALSGCGGGSSGGSSGIAGTTPGTYTVTVSATDNSSSNSTVGTAATYTLTVN